MVPTTGLGIFTMIGKWVDSDSWQDFKKKYKTLWPLFMDGVQLPQG